jgi:hypothetical protein
LPEKRLPQINWLIEAKDDELTKIKSDIEMFVLRSFWSHNKDCPKDVDEKVANTVKLLRRFIIAMDAGEQKPEDKKANKALPGS